jgi:ATP-binding cassette subfamily B protein
MAEEDCGAACIATVAQCHGASWSLGTIRDAVGTTSEGTTLLGLRRGADTLGFQAQAARADVQNLDQLNELPLPLICHWQGWHWVVLHGQQNGQVIVADPAVGLRHLEPKEFLQGWGDRVVLVLEPDPGRFHQTPQQQELGLKVFRHFITPFRPLLGQAIGLNIVIGVLGLSMPLLMQVLTDDVLIRGDTGMLTSLSIGLMLLFGFRALLNLLQGHMVGYFGNKLQLQMILHYGQRLLGLPLSYFENHRSGEVVSRIGDIQQLNTLVSAVVLGLPSQLCIALVSLLLMWAYSASLTVAALLCYAAVLMCNLTFVPAQTRLAKEMLVKSADNQGYLVELFRGIGLLKCSEATAQAWHDYQSSFGRLAHLSWSGLRLDLQQETTTTLLGSVAGVALLWYGSGFVIAQQLSIGQLLAFSGMGANVFAFLTALSGLTQEVLRADVVIQRLADVMERQSELEIHPGIHEVTLAPDSGVICERVTFHHPGRRPLLDGLTVTIPGGVTTALVGESGCGKSTLSKLIAGIYTPQQGTIHYGAYNASDLNRDALRRQVVLVPQDSTLFNRSIFENFRFAHPGVRFDQVVEACRLSLADDFIRELPDGYQTVIGEFATNLSGGQRQRLAIARALIGDPAILILDESTSALDPILERRLMDRLMKHRQGATTVFISHRPSMILRADWLIYLEAGRVREQNAPAALRDSLHLTPFLTAA